MMYKRRDKYENEATKIAVSILKLLHTEKAPIDAGTAALCQVLSSAMMQHDKPTAIVEYLLSVYRTMDMNLELIRKQPKPKRRKKNDITVN